MAVVVEAVALVLLDKAFQVTHIHRRAVRQVRQAVMVVQANNTIFLVHKFITPAAAVAVVVVLITHSGL
jgi:hypothetical protein